MHECLSSKREGILHLLIGVRSSPLCNDLAGFLKCKTHIMFEHGTVDALLC